MLPFAKAETIKLQKLGETGYHKVVDAWRKEDILFPLHISPTDKTFNLDISASQVFVVQHDWAAAFKNATGIDDGELHLPYDDVVFEFRVNGHRICVQVGGTPEEPQTLHAGLIFAETSVGWLLFGRYRTDADNKMAKVDGVPDDSLPLMTMCLEQIRAITIALSSEVAKTEVIRAPYRLNAKRVKAGKVPLYDHHIVSLSNRKHYLPRVAEPGDIETEKTRKRLHFVRAHDRHYPNHVVRIAWHLRGDPDLGYIDKEYRL